MTDDDQQQVFRLVLVSPLHRVRDKTKSAPHFFQMIDYRLHRSNPPSVRFGGKLFDCFVSLQAVRSSSVVGCGDAPAMNIAFGTPADQQRKPIADVWVVVGSVG
jgi:hypothetical protein